MSYLVLARKWRPQTFDDIVGQRPVVRTLRNALQRDRAAHAMLFSGVRGVGKTTLARIMAKALNCHATDDVPCNRCESCLEITKGSALDLHEIDGASNRGIQEIRDLKENIRFFPVRSRFKIIIIDEVHMLTQEAFNALLKTLEEPPAHVFFMFATTELHKVPVTILSRCQRYELSRVPFAELVAYFKKIAAAEAVAISEAGLELIARAAEGSVRDGLSLLDQIFSFGGQEISDADVREVLGLVDQQVFETLTLALLGGDLAQALATLETIYAAGVDLKRFSGDLLGYLRAVLVCKTCSAPNEILDAPDRELGVLLDIAGGHSAETLYQYFQLLLKGIEEMQYSPQPRMVLEMAFIRAVQAGRVMPVNSLIERLDALLSTTPPPAPAVGAPVVVPSPSPAPAVAQAAPVTPPPVFPQGSVGAGQEKKKSEPLTPPRQEIPEMGSRQDVRKDWEAFVDYVKERKRWMAHVLMLATGRREADDELRIKFDEATDCKVLQEKENLLLLTQFAQDFFQREFRVRIVVRGAEDGSGGQGEPDLPQEERRALANDPLVQLVTEVIEGQVVGIRTGPRSR